MNTISRRIFLRQAATEAGLVIGGRGLAGFGQSFVSSGVRGWITAGADRFKEFEVQPWVEASRPGAAVVEVDRSRCFQSILGFGGALTDASCYLLSRMEPEQRRQLLEEFFGAGGLGLSVSRTCIGSSDYSCSAYSFDDSAVADPELKGFSIAHDRAYILPMLREALKANRELFFFATPWSPPGWMKTGGSLLGGSMKKEYFHSYAQYFVKFIEAYRSEGIDIGAVTVQNEVDTDQDGRMPACLWGQEYEIDFIKEFLGPALRDASLSSKIWLLDHNYDLWGRAMDELSDPGVYQFVDGVAWHAYGGEPEAMTKVHDAFPGKNAYWTEGGPFITDPDYVTGWAKWSSEFAGVLKNWARCVVAWNLVLDEKGGPSISPFKCGGVVTLDSKTWKLTRSGQYWGFAHYAKVVRRGARVIASKAHLPGVEHAAFANLDGRFALVLTNQGDHRGVDCQFEGKRIHVELPRDSVVTLQWS